MIGYRPSALDSALVSCFLLVALLGCQRHDENGTRTGPPPMEVAVTTVSPQALPASFDAVGQTAPIERGNEPALSLNCRGSRPWRFNSLPQVAPLLAGRVRGAGHVAPVLRHEPDRILPLEELQDPSFLGLDT